ncbi:hemerythrin domain-containing protein [Cognatishimia sp. MH4019]|uniref:hemerythrin domain-containing protein n=1 Tax=Cognatishimia sp. MH4019 TaxID=2854030 RepID=UPI001CD39B0B|nr:hemerythrin domain-containing protein [Cognatishimia sp. MH4019]
MGKFNRHLSRGQCLEPTQASLLGEPLEFIHEDHLRERQICTLLDQIAQGETSDDAVLSSVLGFLNTELPLHLKDEEEDLFPLLRRRCEAEDEIGRVITKLHADHTHAGEDTPKVIQLLEGLRTTSRLPSWKECEVLKAFASHARRHLILENAIILPFARLRLTETDLHTLHIRMCQRRGLNNLMEAKDDS